jgi:hypothetical protein
MSVRLLPDMATVAQNQADLQARRRLRWSGGRAWCMRAVVVTKLQTSGCESLRAIAAGLDERGIPATRVVTFWLAGFIAATLPQRR